MVTFPTKNGPIEERNGTMTALAADTFTDASFTIAADSATEGWVLKLDGAWITQQIGTVDEVLRALELPSQGTAIIDIGGESTRPDATPIPRRSTRWR